MNINKERTKESLRFKKLIEDAEQVINTLMNFQKRKFEIASKIWLFDRRVFIFVISHNVGYGGKVLRYELVTIVPEDVSMNFETPTLNT